MRARAFSFVNEPGVRVGFTRHMGASPWVRLEDRIRALVIELRDSGDEDDFQRLSVELRAALAEHVRKMAVSRSIPNRRQTDVHYALRMFQ